MGFILIKRKGRFYFSEMIVGLGPVFTFVKKESFTSCRLHTMVGV